MHKSGYGRFLGASVCIPLVGIAILSGCRPEMGGPPEMGPPIVVVATPEQRAVTDYYYYSGTTEAIETVDVRARVSGELIEMHYSPATRVEAGTPLFTIEPDLYQIAVDAAQADVDRAKAALELAKITQERVVSAFERQAATEIEKRESDAGVLQADAELRAADARLRDAQRELAYTDVAAPITGRVSRAFVDPGNLVGGGEQTVLTQVVRMDPIWVYFDVSERIVLEYLGRGQAGDVGDEPIRPPVEVALASSPDDVYPYLGVINWVDNQVDEATGTIRVRGELPNADGELFPGLFVRARVPKDELPDALLIPEGAIETDLDGKSVKVVNAENIVERRAVRLGPREGDLRVILEGIGPEDRVVVAGLQKAQPGRPVQPQTETETAASPPAASTPAPAE